MKLRTVPPLATAHASAHLGWTEKLSFLEDGAY